MEVNDVIRQLVELRKKNGNVGIGFEDPNFHSIRVFEEIKYDEEIKMIIIKW